MRVLVVDDDPNQRILLRLTFETRGVDDVVEADNGVSALEAAERDGIDLVVLDLAMPVMSGIEVLPRLHQVLPDVPIVVLSHFRRNRVEKLVASHGATGYIEKDTPQAQLFDEIMTVAGFVAAAREAIVASTQLPGDLTSARLARQFVEQTLESSPFAELLDTAQLLISELVTNAVVHGNAEPRVDIHLDGTSVRFEVHDDDPTLPTAGTADSLDESGRGLGLVESLAPRWGAEPTAGGKIVWFEIDRV
jgi:CheY-like chemotaxis protein